MEDLDYDLGEGHQSLIFVEKSGNNLNFYCYDPLGNFSGYESKKTTKLAQFMAKILCTPGGSGRECTIYPNLISNMGLQRYMCDIHGECTVVSMLYIFLIMKIKQRDSSPISVWGKCLDLFMENTFSPDQVKFLVFALSHYMNRTTLWKKFLEDTKKEYKQIPYDPEQDTDQDTKEDTKENPEQDENTYYTEESFYPPLLEEEKVFSDLVEELEKKIDKVPLLKVGKVTEKKIDLFKKKSSQVKTE